MNFGKCLFYGIVIGILIIILIKLCKSIKENFDEMVEEVDVKEIEEVKEEPEEIEEPEKTGIVSSITDAVSSAVESVKNIITSDEKEEEPEETDPIALTKDNLENVLEGPADVNALETDGVAADLTILPKFIDTTTSTVMDGSKMIPQSTVDAWQDIYMNEDNDNSFMIDLGGDDKKTNKDQGSGRFSDRSPACCSAQYPVPFKIPVEEGLVKNAHEYVPNPYMGNNNWMNAGCSCMKRNNASKLATRGGNA